MIRVGINGFGRIGRSLFRVLAAQPNIEVVMVNDLATPEVLIHLLKFDTTQGALPFELQYENGVLSYLNKQLTFSSAGSPDDIPWSDQDVDYVFECSGRFKTRATLTGHLKSGVKKVILSVPPKDDSIPLVVMGVNDEALDMQENIISNSSCTTNCAAPMIKVIAAHCKIESAYISTIHSYTSDQSLQDAPHEDLRRARAAAQSIIPTTTGAAKALGKIFEGFEIGGCGIRVPVPNGSLTDINFFIKEDLNVAEVNQWFKDAADHELKGILEYNENPMVSVDVIGNSHSCVLNPDLTSVVGKMLKVVAWYDNEMGYSNRLKDLLLKIAK